MRYETIDLPNPIRITPIDPMHGYECADKIQYDHKTQEASLLYGHSYDRGDHGSYIGPRWAMTPGEWERERTYWLNKGGALAA